VRRIIRRGGAHSQDSFDYSENAYALWSVARRLNPLSLGPLIRVRRSSDNAEQDIPQLNGRLDTANLLSFVGTGPTDDGFVVTVIGQIVSSANLEQSVAGLQPLIVSGGVLVTNAEGHPACSFGGTKALQSTAFVPGTLAQPNTLWLVWEHTTWVVARGILDGRDATNRQLIWTQGVSPRIDQYAGASANANTDMSIGASSIISAGFDGASSFLRVDDNAKVTGGNPGTNGLAGVTIGANYLLGAGSIGRFTECQVIDTIDAADEAARLADTNSFYGAF